MIVLENLTKTYILRGFRRTVLNDVSALFPSHRSIGLLGRNGEGKSTLLRMIAGTTSVTSGRILSDGSISFPVGFAGSFHPEMTGAQNIRFVARAYGADTDALIAYVEDFAELGNQFYLPIRSYSSGMKSRLAFGLSMGLKFDTYLIDEITAVGDVAFRKKSEKVFLDRMSTASAIFVSHSVGALRAMCNAGAVLDRGSLYYYDQLDDAIRHHERNMLA